MSGNNIKQLPLLPLRDLVVFPYMMMPFFVGREKNINALEEAMSKQTEVVLTPQKDIVINDPSPEQIYSVGTAASIIQLLRLPDGTVKVLVEGKKRVRIIQYVQQDSFFKVEVEEIDEKTSSNLEVKALMRSLKKSFENYVKLNKYISPESLMAVTNISDNPSMLSDVVAAQLNLRLEHRQELIEIFDPAERLENLLNRITGEIEILEVEKKIRGRVKKQMERSQKEYYLNEQMQAIQKELGEKDDYFSELKDLDQQANKKKISKEAKEKILKEIKKLKMMSPTSAEAAVVRNYVDWVLSLPWMDYRKTKADIYVAEKILNEDHWGLKEVKKRIIEHLAVQTLTDKIQGPILCLVGPPGVGKTSLARSVARSLGRDFARISLGGVKDESEIRGHRKTYVGAMPGKVIQAMRKVEKGNPLILLDEVDKMGNDFRGDPASAMLEVLDPEQNKNFQDHYLELDYDLSRVMFLATANSLHPIPKPLLDRMEIIRLEGYIEDEKFHIAKEYLLPKQIKNHGLSDKKYKVSFTDRGVRELIRSYTKEAGVRELERKIKTILRKTALSIVKAKAKLENKKTFSAQITPKVIHEMLDHRKQKFSRIEGRNEIGMTNGLAWTEVGGDLLVVEVSVVPGKGKFVITGQLGDVMKESCSAAMSYVRSRGPLFGFEKEVYFEHDVHIHVPEGSVPKDGPSAGVAITTSIVSAFARIPVKRTVAMTGEVTLRGSVLEIGGLKEKILAAHRGGIKMVIIPKENKRDLKDIPEKVKKDLKIIAVDHVDQVLVNALAMENARELFKVLKQRETGLRARHTGHSLRH